MAIVEGYKQESMYGLVAKTIVYCGEVAVSGVLCALMKYGFFSWGHCIDNLFQEATAEDQGKLAKEYPLTVSLPKDCNDDRDEKEINRISKLSNGKI